MNLGPAKNIRNVFEDYSARSAPAIRYQTGAKLSVILRIDLVLYIKLFNSVTF